MKLPTRSAVKIRTAQMIKRSMSGVLPERTSISLQYFLHFRRRLRWNALKNFTEKMQYYKVQVRDPRMPDLVDKIRSKKFVESKLGQEWVIPTIWHGKTLPPITERNWKIPYVLKANHGCSWNIFIRSPGDQNWDRIEKTTKSWLSRKYGVESGQWAYSNVSPQLLVEPFINNTDNLPVDYKFFVFSGVVHYVQVDADREEYHRRAFFDRSWRKQPFTTAFRIYEDEMSPPTSLKIMIEAAETLGQGFPFVRVDFYEVEGLPKFGELTFYPGSGFSKFQPAKYDRVFGDLLQLPASRAWIGEG